ncbi:MAG: hypothetical protein HYU36_22380 [Planctomycetes bacterium]|nr:hypothetical protein [Planctomycetota bacterium]
METWTVADRATLKGYYGSELQESALPSLVDLDQRRQEDVQDDLGHATRDCSNACAKGTRSFEILGRLKPAALQCLPSFARVGRVLAAKL